MCLTSGGLCRLKPFVLPLVTNGNLSGQIPIL